MNKLYVFAIGGSGERVMRSFILTLASGVKIDAQSVVPVFVDNDEKSKALTTCLDLIKYYNSKPEKSQKMGINTSHQKISATPTDWPSFCRTIVEDPIILNTAGDSVGTLSKVIGNIDVDSPVYKAIKDERELLFTDDDLSMPLSVGFVGNPNIGSVVLNALSLGSADFKAIQDTTSPTDGVIIVGSLFGGTGAAGIPLIVNSFNKLDPARKPILGAIAMLPYFSTTDTGKLSPINRGKWDVKPDSFETKTRAALMYYDDYMRALDVMYYIGDGDKKDSYPHCVGGIEQDNPAHLTELMGAMSIMDFAKLTGHNNSIVYKEPVWGINDDNKVETIPTNFSGITNSEIRKALVKFRMMKQMFTDPAFLQWAIQENKDYVLNIGYKDQDRTQVVDERLISDNTWGLNNMLRQWEKWMQELMRDNANRKFALYNNTTPANDDNLTHNFYANTEDGIKSGIAKVEKKRKNIFKGTTVSIPVNAQIGEAMQQAYKKLYPKGKKEDANTIPEEQRLPILLRIISLALDEVIEKRCVDM